MTTQWAATDAAIFRDFLDTPTGKKLFELHKASRPKVSAKSFEEVALEAKVITGWELSEEFFDSMASFNETPAKEPDFIEVSKD